MISRMAYGAPGAARKGDQLGPVRVVLDAAPNDGRHNPPGCDHAKRDAVSRDAKLPEFF